jgi:hypothetical protein
MQHIHLLPPFPYRPPSCAMWVGGGHVVGRNAGLLGGGTEGDRSNNMAIPAAHPSNPRNAMHSCVATRRFEALPFILSHLISLWMALARRFPTSRVFFAPPQICMHEVASLNPGRCAFALICLFSCDAVFERRVLNAQDSSAHHCTSPFSLLYRVCLFLM